MMQTCCRSIIIIESTHFSALNCMGHNHEDLACILGNIIKESNYYRLKSSARFRSYTKFRPTSKIIWYLTLKDQSLTQSRQKTQCVWIICYWYLFCDIQWLSKDNSTRNLPATGTTLDWCQLSKVQPNILYCRPVRRGLKVDPVL